MKISFSFLEDGARASGFSSFSEKSAAQAKRTGEASKNIIPLFGGMKHHDGQILSDRERETFEERAGILEFDAGLTREEAERQARNSLLLFGAAMN